jgi:phosphate acetyltransferase/phosphate butyryltransferase
MADTIENRTYAEIQLGEAASISRTVSEQDIQLFAALTGDINPAHLDHDYAASSMFGGVIAHGMFGGAMFSTVLGTILPGPGTIYLGQTMRFTRPVKPGDRLTATVSCREKYDDKQRVIFDCVCVNQDGKAVIKGEAEVIAPSDKVCRPAATLPSVALGGVPYSVRA